MRDAEEPRRLGVPLLETARRRRMATLSDDLYVRARAWTPRRATKAGTATAGAGVEGSAGDGDGAGNAPAVNTTNGDGGGDGSAGEAAADNDDGTDPVRLLCVPAGCRRDATLHQLVTAASAEFDVPVELLRIVRQQAGGAWLLLAWGAEAFGDGKQGAPGAAGGGGSRRNGQRRWRRRRRWWRQRRRWWWPRGGGRCGRRRSQRGSRHHPRRTSSEGGR